MSEIATLREGHAPEAPPQPTGPFKNPSYPARVHVRERAHWRSVLADCEERVHAARARLEALGNSPNRLALERLLAQMMGARDQVAETTRRLPGEVGALYHEDHERLEQAIAAMDRVVKAWDALVR